MIKGYPDAGRNETRPRGRLQSIFPLALSAYLIVVASTSFTWPYSVMALGVVAIVAMPSVRMRDAVRRLEPHAWLVAALTGGLLLVNLALYPATRIVMHPSTGPDALLVPLQRLLGGNEPYKAPLWDGALISPGPGWWLLNAPLSGLGLFPWLCPVWLFVASIFFARRTALASVIFLLLLFESQDFIAQSVSGHDIFVVNIAICVVCLLAEQVAKGTAPLMPTAILAGLVATARTPLMIVLFVLGLGLARRNGRLGIIFTGIAVLVALTLHLFFGLWAARDGVFYPPLHVFGRARGGAGLTFILISVISACAAATWIIRHVRDDAAQLMFCCWLLEFCLFAPIGIGELVNVNGFKTALWEGRNYVAWSLPLLCGYLGLHATRRGQEQEPRRMGERSATHQIAARRRA